MEGNSKINVDNYVQVHLVFWNSVWYFCNNYEERNSNFIKSLKFIEKFYYLKYH